jgi:hypothetical protein
MVFLGRIGSQTFEGRELFTLSVRTPEDIPQVLDLPSPYFACLVAWDATTASDKVVRALAEKLVCAGCAYACCWGPGCERLHDMIDLVVVERDPTADRVVITTWHERESLSAALWFLLNLSQPDPAYKTGCGCSLAISIGSEQWAAEIRSAMADPSALESGFDVPEDEPE